MNELIEAFTILSKYLSDYGNKFPTLCEHDVFYVCEVNVSDITAEEVRRLYELGFIPGNQDDGDIREDIELSEIDQETWDNIKDRFTECFHSYRYGSC